VRLGNSFLELTTRDYWCAEAIGSGPGKRRKIGGGERPQPKFEDNESCEYAKQTGEGPHRKKTPIRRGKQRDFADRELQTNGADRS
jgi:hypothetical protein